MPLGFAGGGICAPRAKGGGECVEIQVEAITGAGGDAPRRQGQCHRVDQGVRQGLSAWPDAQGGYELGLRGKGCPDPRRVGLVAQGGLQRIELQMAAGQVAEEVRAHFFGVRAGAGEPETQGGIGMTEEQLDSGYGEVEIDGQEHPPDVPGGGVKAIEGGAPAAGEAFFASLAPLLWDAVAAAIADEGGDGGITGLSHKSHSGLGQACPAVQMC